MAFLYVELIISFVGGVLDQWMRSASVTVSDRPKTTVQSDIWDDFPTLFIN
jgi:hypothetical protein